MEKGSAVLQMKKFKKKLEMWHPLSQMGEGSSGLLPVHSVNQCLECYEGALENMKSLLIPKCL